MRIISYFTIFDTKTNQFHDHHISIEIDDSIELDFCKLYQCIKLLYPSSFCVSFKIV